LILRKFSLKILKIKSVEFPQKNGSHVFVRENE